MTISSRFLSLFFCIFLLTIFSCKTTKDFTEVPKLVESQGYILNVAFLPDSEYVTELTQDTNTKMEMGEMPPQDAINRLVSASTLKFGPLVNGASEMLIVYDTMYIQSTGTGSDKLPDFNGMKIHGKLTSGVQSIDSIVGGETSMHSMMAKLMEPMFNNLQIDFPNPMKIGDQFDDHKVIEIPLEGMGSSSIVMNTKYTLTKVEEGQAYLDLIISMSGTMSIMDKEFPLEGTGTGDMSIDLAGQYCSLSSTVIDQKMAMEMQGMTINQDISVSMVTKTQKVK